MDNNFNIQYSKLNREQKKAVDTIDGPVIVIAGPGSGKTQLLSMRVANILNKTDTQPDNILCLTFTDAAADNLRSRLSILTGQTASRVAIYTFHGFGTHIIQNYPEYFYDNPLLNHISELAEFELLSKILSKLDHDNPLSKQVAGSYLHLNTISKTISWFKQAGLSPKDLRNEAIKNHSFFNQINKNLAETFSESPSSKNINKYEKLHSSIIEIASKNLSHLALASAQELRLAIDDIDSKTRYAKAITRWRNNWLTQVKTNHWQYADQIRNNILLEVSKIYEEYELSLTNNGLYSYDDMILRSYQAITGNEELKLILQEKYQYILVDEYQDTNGAQDKLLTILASNIVNEGKPNLMVVGDDDQAIYRFQGAEYSIMQDFIKLWDPEVIVLVESYRSGQELLNLAKNVIINASNRLESSNTKINKNLISAGKTKKTLIGEIESNTENEYFLHITNQIKTLLNSGNIASSIAVISPKHKYLHALIPYLLANSIPINYERREQILEQPRIVEVLDLIELTWAISKTKIQNVEAMLPKIMGAQYFRLPPSVWWEIAVDAQRNNQGWLKAMSTSKSNTVRDFTLFIKKVGVDSLNNHFETSLAYLLGNRPVTIEDGRQIDMPFRDYYFSESSILDNPSDFLKFIEQLDTLVQNFKNYYSLTNELVTLTHFHDFIELFKKSKLSMLHESPYSTSKNAVNLLTAYKSKGLEFDNVIILNCQNNVWGPKVRNQNLSFRLPSTLKWIEPSRVDSNDLVRLFYVAITRARKNLILSRFTITQSGKQTERLEWLADSYLRIKKLHPKPLNPVSLVDSYKQRSDDLVNIPIKDLRILLKPHLDLYKLSATHLNEFLAVDKGGPKNFLFKYILKVPEISMPSTMYGDNIHKTLEYTHRQFKNNGKMPKTPEIINFFNERLKTYPFSKSELRFYKKRGNDNLSRWFEANRSKFRNNDIAEHNFTFENITIGKARLTGKIDVLRRIDENNLIVIDYKTSPPIYRLLGKKGSSSIRSSNYLRQLMFYKLLTEKSNSFNKFKVKHGQIEFITPTETGEIISLNYEYKKDDTINLSKLINIVWEKIINLDIPDTSKYPASLTGIRDFEADLLNGKI